MLDYSKLISLSHLLIGDAALAKYGLNPANLNNDFPTGKNFAAYN
ncbi:hypothetical protein [Methylocucumis oryzae]|nr:hypothetical protein [Methylocucumis oryzae]